MTATLAAIAPADPPLTKQELEHLFMAYPMTRTDHDHLPQMVEIVWSRYCQPRKETLKSLGQRFALGPTMIRHREARALRLLRAPGRTVARLACQARWTDALYQAIYGEMRWLMDRRPGELADEQGRGTL